MLPWLTESPATHLSEVRDTSLAKLVRNDVLALILKGVLVPGQRINEPDVAARLEVSRVPVREALRELESSGLVVSRKHAGVFVRHLDANEVRDLYQMRALLDGYAGRCAALLQTEQRNALLAVLNSSVNTMQQAANQRDVQGYYNENLCFHWAIVAAAGNTTLTETYRGIVQKLHLIRLKNLSQDMGVKSSMAEHLEIVQALQNADAVHCESLMAQHVSGAYTRFAAAQVCEQQSTNPIPNANANPNNQRPA